MKSSNRIIVLPAVLAAFLTLLPVVASAQESQDIYPELPRLLSDTGPPHSSDKLRRVVIFGGDHDGAPMEYLNTSGNPAGFNVDLMRAIGEEMNLEVQVILSRWPDIRRGIMGDEAMDQPPPQNQARLPLDVVALYYLSERDQYVDYTGPFLIEHSDVFVRRNSPVEVNVADPGTLRVGIMRGGYTADYFRTNHPGARFLFYDAETEALRQLHAGNLDAAIVGQLTGRYAIRAYGLADIRPEGTPFLARQYCFGVRKGDTELRDILNQGLERIRASGRYEEIYQKWFGHSAGTLSVREVLLYVGVVAVPLLLAISAVLIWNASLKRKVAVRTAELARELSKQHEAQRASHLASLGELSAGVAHEINNPNGLILLQIPFLLQAFDDALSALDNCEDGLPGGSLAGLPYERARQEIPRALTAMLESARRIRRIVEDLRNFARPAARGEFAGVDLGAVTDTAIRLTGNALKNASAALTVSIEPGLPEVPGNQHQLEQVIVNLLLNAAQALTAAGQAVAVRAWKHEASGQVTLEVRDEGKGMDADTLAHATAPFFTTRREQGGTGLGLSLTASILKEHRATMEILSEPGKGTSFIITFPAGPTVNATQERR